MADEKMTTTKAAQLYAQGFHCSQVVLEYAAEELGLDKETALRIASCFGGGMFQSEVCGCVTGALMALGFQYGHDQPYDADAGKESMDKALEFEECFLQENGSILCRELLGYDVFAPESKEKMALLCPKLAVSACDILDELL